MSTSTLLLLLAVWAVVLLPRALRDVRSSPLSTVTGFSRTMARLAVCDRRLLVVPSGSGRRVVALPRRSAASRAIRRRRTVLGRLMAVTAVAVPVAVVLRHPVASAVAAVAVVSLVAYCAAMRTIAVRRAGSGAAPRRDDRRAPRTSTDTRLRQVPAAPAATATIAPAALVPAGRGVVAAERPSPVAPAGWLDEALDRAGASAHDHAPLMVADGS